MIKSIYATASNTSVLFKTKENYDGCVGGTLYTGFCYIDKANKIDYSATAITKYVLRKLPEDEIDKFIENNLVTEWAAAFSPAYPYQLGFIKHIEGSLTGSTHGLPVELLISCFEKSGVIIKP